jgi:hypothetical protein
VILAAGFPLGRAKADHCHTTEGQTAPANVQPPAQPAPSSAERSRAARRIATPIPGPQNARAQSGPASSTTTPASATTASIEQIYSRDLPLAIQSIGQAVKAIESGDRQTELAELTKAVTMLAAIHEALGKHVKPPSTPSATGVGAQASRAQSRDLANSRCPIMGSAINPDSVAANLTRDYKGQKIGFCCAGCPSAWDKLTDAEKQVKFSAVKS